MSLKLLNNTLTNVVQKLNRNISIQGAGTIQPSALLEHNGGQLKTDGAYRELAADLLKSRGNEGKPELESFISNWINFERITHGLRQLAGKLIGVARTDERLGNNGTEEMLQSKVRDRLDRFALKLEDLPFTEVQHTDS